MDAYLSELDRATHHRLSILQSNGGYITAAEARRHAVRTILSGPAGGVVGAGAAAGLEWFRTRPHLRHGRDIHRRQPLGKASSELRPWTLPWTGCRCVCLCSTFTRWAQEAGQSRAWMKADCCAWGPRARAPIPGRHATAAGEQATVTDAHVVLGRIAADQFLGGEMHIEAARAAAAVDRLARVLKRNRVTGPQGMVRIANANMERAIRVVSVERGRDPRDSP